MKTIIASLFMALRETDKCINELQQSGTNLACMVHHPQKGSLAARQLEHVT